MEPILEAKEVGVPVDELPLKDVRFANCHELVKAHEVKNLALLSNLTFRSSLEREESRHSHYRQDFPYRDDKNWLKWILVKQDYNGELKLRMEPVPFEQYSIRPKQPAILPSPIKFD